MLFTSFTIRGAPAVAEGIVYNASQSHFVVNAAEAQSDEAANGCPGHNLTSDVDEAKRI